MNSARRSRSSRVKTARLPTPDVNRRDNYLRAGEPQFFGSSADALPRSGSIHRSRRADFQIGDVLRGYGAQPHVSRAPQRLSPRALAQRIASLTKVFEGARPRARPPASPSPLTQDWREFNTLRFHVPHLTKICHRRKQRKEVLFAKGFSGRNGRGRGGGYHRNAFSHWSC